MDQRITDPPTQKPLKRVTFSPSHKAAKDLPGVGFPYLHGSTIKTHQVNVGK